MRTLYVQRKLNEKSAGTDEKFTGKVMIKMANTENKANANEKWKETYLAKYDVALTLPKDHPDAFKGENPYLAASKAQRAKLDELGIKAGEKATQLSAHASIRAYAELYPDKFATANPAKTAEAKSANAAEAWKATYQEKYEAALTLPKDNPDAFKGKNPYAPASDAQKAKLEELGINAGEKATRVSASAAIQAAKVCYPEKFAQVQAKSANVTTAEPKAAEPKVAEPEKAADGKNYAAKAYSVNNNHLGLPATYTQMMQLNLIKGADGNSLRSFSDATPIPTRSEVATKLNEVRVANPAEYNRGMAATEKYVESAKHNPPSAAQVAFAEKVGISGVNHKNSTAFKTGEKIHDLRISNPEAYNAAKNEKATPSVPAPNDLAAKVAFAASKAVANEAAKTSGIPTLKTADTAPQKQNEAQAGG